MLFTEFVLSIGRVRWHCRRYYTYHVLDSKVSSLAYVILGHVLMSLGGYAGDAEGMYA